MYGDWGVRTIIIINSDMMGKNVKIAVVVIAYDGGDLHILDVRATELQQKTVICSVV